MAHQSTPDVDVVETDEQLTITIPSAARHPKARMITRSQIHPDPEQPRKQADAGLRESIARNGLLQPITVRPHPELLTEWMIVDGERRWRSTEGVIEDLMCFVRTDMDEILRRVATQLEANTGKPLTPLEEARAFKQIIDATGKSAAEVATLVGRPKSTVGERLSVLDLGPWVELIESGELQISHAVKRLLPLRMVPDAWHAEAIIKFRAEFSLDGARRGSRNGQERLEVTLDQFTWFVRRTYAEVMYPLTKTKVSWQKQPIFSTSKHDQECECGGIKFALDGEDERLCCANPSWWRPLDTAAKKELKKKERDAQDAAQAKTAKSSGKKLHLPEVAKLLSSEHGGTPKGVVQLTDGLGQWATFGRDPFDPADLAIDETKLVYWPSSVSNGFPCVGTKDLKAVEAAQEQWDGHFKESEARAIAKLKDALAAHRAEYNVTGPGCALLVGMLDLDEYSEFPVWETIGELLPALGIEIPKKLSELDEWQLAEGLRDWMRTLPVETVSEVLTGLAVMRGKKIARPSEAKDKAVERLTAAICKREIPWKKAPKAGKSAAAKKGAKVPANKGKAAALPMEKFSEDTAELPLGDPRVPAAAVDDGDEDEGWAPPAALGDGDVEEDDLWDSQADVGEEEEVEA